MKIDMTGDQPTIDARDLGEPLELPPDEVQNLMHAGKITSRFETGESGDAGMVRLTFVHRSRRVRLTCSKDGTVLKTSCATTERL